MVPRRFAIALCVCALLASARAAQAPLTQLSEEFWTWRAATAPFTTDDIPRLERPGGMRDWSQKAVTVQIAKLEDFEKHWRALDVSRWPVPDQVDYRLLGSALARVRWELVITHRWQSDPNFYIEQTVTALQELAILPRRLEVDESAELLTRVRNIPSILQQGRANLNRPPQPFAKLAVEMLSDIRPRLSRFEKAMLSNSTLRESDLAPAIETASAALESYRDWLKPQVPNLPPSAAVGRQAYTFFLREVALLPYTPEQLLAMAQQEFARIVAFEDYERHRNAGLPELPLYSDEKTEIAACVRYEQMVRDYLNQHAVMTIPAWERHYTLVAMPPQVEALEPFAEADYFASQSRVHDDAVRYIKPPSETLSYFWLATAKDPRPEIVHEGVPGHALQLALSWQHPDLIRRRYYDSAANEGIGFYAEEMALQAGVFDDRPRLREVIYNYARLRALRVEVDVKLATGVFTLQQAADQLQRSVPEGADSAHEEVMLFASTPGQKISYQIGKQQILEFLKDARLQQGAGFDLRKFHDFLWLNGNVPIALQRWEYLGKRDDLDRVAQVH